MFRGFCICLIGGILLLSFLSCSKSDEKTESMAEDLGNSAPVDSMVIVLQGDSGKTAFDLLQETHEVEFIDSPAGKFVHIVDSLQTGSKYGWMYSVNGSMGTVASDKYVTSDSDVIRWHYRKY